MGALTTAVIQSSSVTTVLVVGFVSAGLLSMTQSVGVIMGANVGTTITAQIIAFKITKASLVMIAIGFAMKALGKRQRTKRYGKGLLGLGLVFLGMTIMGDAVAPLRAHQPFLDTMARLEAPALGILAGAAFTALLQSSSATTGVVIVLASQGLITLPAGISLVFGANVGTCVTAIIASIGKPREAVRVAGVHVLFNVLGVLLWLGFIPLLAKIVTGISPPGDTPRQIANAHTVFNLANTILFLPFAPLFARAVQILIPDRVEEDESGVRAKYVSHELLDSPALALGRARLEILHLGNHAKKMLIAILPAILTGTRDEIEEVAARDDRIDSLHGQVVTYLGLISQQELSERETADLVHLMEAANDLENIGDVIETNLARLGYHRLELGVAISPETQAVLTAFHREVVRAFDTALLAVTQTNVEAADVVCGMKADINRMAEAAARHGAGRLVAKAPHRRPAYQIETDMLENLKRIYYFSKRMARIVVSRSG
jgi:phosphate:Na+ symporter